MILGSAARSALRVLMRRREADADTEILTWLDNHSRYALSLTARHRGVLDVLRHHTAHGRARTARTGAVC